MQGPRRAGATFEWHGIGQNGTISNRLTADPSVTCFRPRRPAFPVGSRITPLAAMSEEILVLNAGSSSVRFALYTAEREPARVLHGIISGIGVAPGFSAEDTDGRPLPAELPPAGAAP